MTGWNQVPLSERYMGTFLAEPEHPYNMHAGTLGGTESPSPGGI